MKRVMIFQHVPYEILGTLHPLLKKRGLRLRYANFGRHPDAAVDINDYDGLIILGGPMGVYESEKHSHLKTEMQQIEMALKQDKPVFGICLGAQLIAAVLGAPVAPGPRKEIGWFDISLTEEGTKDPLLSHMKATEKIFQWHGDNFDLPKTAHSLASSPVCPYQAFRYGKNVYGFQFHLEVDEPMVHRWLKVPAMRKELEVFAGETAPDTVLQDTESHIGRLKELSDKVFSTYLDLFATNTKRVVLNSRH